MRSEPSVFRSFVFVALGVVLLEVFGCTGAVRQDAAGLLTDLPAAVPAAHSELVAGLPPLPDDGALPRAASAEVEQTKQGDDTFDQSAGAVAVGATLVLATGVASELEWGIYQFPLGGNAPVRFETDVTVAGGVYWLALANYATQTWQLSGPFDVGAVQTMALPAADYTSPGDNAYLAVIAATIDDIESDITVNAVTFVSDDGTLPRLAVSGTVTDAVSSAPLPGVTLTLNPGGVVELSDLAGNFSFDDVAPGSYTLTPTLTGYDFAPPVRIVEVVEANVTGQDFAGTPEPPTFTISGTITDTVSVGPLAGVTVTLNPGGIEVLTNGSGLFQFTDVEPGNYTLTPTLAGYSFAPPSRAVLVAAADVPDQDFDATPAPTYSISGTITDGIAMGPLAGVTVTLEPGGTQVQTDGAGLYQFDDLAPGDYTLTPSLIGFSFTPPSREVQVVDADVPDQDFTGEPAAGFSISGTVTDSSTASGLEGVVISLEPGGIIEVTDPDGNYIFTDIVPGSYVLTPALEGYTFDPPERMVEVIDDNVTGQDFTGDPVPPTASLSGTVTTEAVEGIADVAMYLLSINADGSINSLNFRMTTTDAAGAYQFDDMAAGDYRLIPQKDSMVFTPNIVALTFSTSEQRDFTGLAVNLPATVTYGEHMLPWLFEPVCMNCHDSAKTGPARNFAPANVNWDTYNGTTDLQKSTGALRVQAGTMPPATLGFGTTQFQKDLFQQWLDDGFQEN